MKLPKIKCTFKYDFSREKRERAWAQYKDLKNKTTYANKHILAPIIKDLKFTTRNCTKMLFINGVEWDSISLNTPTPTKLRHIRSYLKDLRRAREELKTKLITNKKYNGYIYSTEGGVFTTKAIALKRKFEVVEVFKEKKPKRSDKLNYVGVEIELLSSITKEQMAILLCENKLSNKVTIHSDTSIYRKDEQDVNFCYELCIIDREDKIKETLKNLENIFKNNNYVFRVNETCGTHIHLDMRYRNISRCYGLLYNSLDDIYKSVADHRNGNVYCTRNITADYNEASLKYSSTKGPRYQAINPESYCKHNTLEIRLFEGTLDMDKVIKWLDLLLEIINVETQKAVVNV